MNGLKVVRVQCNFTIMDLAKKLGVSKQAVSSWETGKKEIPEARKKQLSEIFGLDPSFLGEIDEAKLKELESKAKFRRTENGEEHFSYDIRTADAGKRVMAYYDKIREFTIYDELAKKKEQQKELEKGIHESFDGAPELSVSDQILYVNRGLDLYSRFLDIIHLFYGKRPEEKMVYYHRIIETLAGVQKALGGDPNIQERTGLIDIIPENVDAVVADFENRMKVAEAESEKQLMTMADSLKHWMEQDHRSIAMDADGDPVEQLHQLLVENGISHEVTEGFEEEDGKGDTD